MRRWGPIAVALAVVVIVAAGQPGAAGAAGGPDPAVREWPAWPFESSCGALPFDPVGVFGGATGAELGTSPSERALRRFLAEDGWMQRQVPARDWRLLAETGERAEFASGRLVGSGATATHALGPAVVSFVRDDSGWRWSGISGGCMPATIVNGFAAVTWTLAVDKPWPRRGARRIWIRLGPGGCSSGRSQSARARRPVFRRLGGGRLAMVMTLRPLPPGAYTCQGVIEPPMQVRLPRRFGSVRLFDGGVYPPRDVRRLRRAAPPR